MTWAVAQIGERDCMHTAALLDTLATTMAASVHSLTSRYMANVVWGLANLRFRSLAVDHLLDSVAIEAGNRGKEFSPKVPSIRLLRIFFVWHFCVYDDEQYHTHFNVSICVVLSGAGEPGVGFRQAWSLRG
jgi:hypothetical protein